MKPIEGFTKTAIAKSELTHINWIFISISKSANSFKKKRERLIKI